MLSKPLLVFTQDSSFISIWLPRKQIKKRLRPWNLIIAISMQPLCPWEQHSFKPWNPRMMSSSIKHVWMSLELSQVSMSGSTRSTLWSLLASRKSVTYIKSCLLNCVQRELHQWPSTSHSHTWSLSIFTLMLTSKRTMKAVSIQEFWLHPSNIARSSCLEIQCLAYGMQHSKRINVSQWIRLWPLQAKVYKLLVMPVPFHLPASIRTMRRQLTRNIATTSKSTRRLYSHLLMQRTNEPVSLLTELFKGSSHFDISIFSTHL